MRSLVAILIALAALLAPSAQAQVLSVEEWVEEWDESRQEWVRIEDGAARLANLAPAYTQGSYTPPAPLAAIADGYGPFRVTGANSAELVGLTDRASPRHFERLLRDHPGITVLKFVEAPGTDDDRANLALGRMIREAGITTHVPHGGSVRSGAVELFLAGAARKIDEGAEFAVHSWIDIHGKQPHDYAIDARENRIYLDYYREMGMAPQQARAFYDMTNSVGFDGAKWLTAQDMRVWLGQGSADTPADGVAGAATDAALEDGANTNIVITMPRIELAEQIAYLDSDAMLP